ncbi:hypothetical protein C8J56DRAFT_1068917 [Mycena floridula]|nr:hypothetical protein C8J56DRAFT_1068917 [Mycena floridula]
MSSPPSPSSTSETLQDKVHAAVNELVEFVEQEDNDGVRNKYLHDAYELQRNVRKHTGSSGTMNKVLQFIVKLTTTAEDRKRKLEKLKGDIRLLLAECREASQLAKAAQEAAIQARIRVSSHSPQISPKKIRRAATEPPVESPLSLTMSRRRPVEPQPTGVISGTSGDRVDRVHHRSSTIAFGPALALDQVVDVDEEEDEA